MKREESILIVDDEPNMQRVLRGLLQREGYRTLEVSDGAAALEILAREPIEAVLTDFKMPRMNGLELLAEIQQRQLGVPVILLTAHGTIGGAVEALKKGAFDYLTKPFDPDEIQQVVAKAVRTHALQKSEATVAIAENPEQLLLGESDALRRVKHLIERVAPTPATVLITGESGTGKELVARSLHLRSPRATAPFVKINCAAIPEGLLESELFGHEKGAFTGAARRKLGRFELADGGTLFLDEIGEIPVEMQVKLLRAIQEKRVRKVGATGEEAVDVRIISATHRSLGEEVKQGKFRQDLYYRLNVIELRMPPLREMREDIPLLTAAILRRHTAANGSPAPQLSAAAMERLAGYDFPGNVRELENVLERALALTTGGDIRAEDLQLAPAQAAAAVPAAAAAASGLPLQERLDTVERQAILAALEQTRYNRTAAAKLLGITFRALRYRMERLGIKDELDSKP